MIMTIYIVFFHISSPRSTRPIINIKYRKYNNIDTNTFIIEFSKKFNNTQFSNSVSKLETALSKTLDELAPIKYKYITQRPHCKWFNSELSSSKRKLRLYENYWRKSKSFNYQIIYLSNNVAYIEPYSRNPRNRNTIIY